MSYLLCQLNRSCSSRICLTNLPINLFSRSLATRRPVATTALPGRSSIFIRHGFERSILTTQWEFGSPERSIQFKSTHLPIPQLFQNDVFSINKIFVDYRTSEQEHYFNMNDENMRMLGLENAPSWAAAIRFSTHIEILTTLEGVKPCVLFYADTKASGTKSVFDKQVKTHILPWFKKHRLAQFGFVLQKINHDLIIDGLENWRGVWVFADTRSEGWASVADVFFNPKNAVQHGLAIGEALGLPILPGLPNCDARYTYVDVTTRSRLRNMIGDEVGDVIAHDYVGSKDKIQEEEVHAHFEEWREVAAKHGIVLELQMGVNPLGT